MAFDNVLEEKICDNALWLLIYKVALGGSKHDRPDKIYDLIIPFVTGKPLEESALPSYDDAATPLRSPQRSSTAYFRCIWESFHYLMLRRGLSSFNSKLVQFLFRYHLLDMVSNDLQFTESLSDSDLRLVRMGYEQVCYVAVKLTEFSSKKNVQIDTELSTETLEHVKLKIDKIGEGITINHSADFL
jgi:hypothetical protein